MKSKKNALLLVILVFTVIPTYHVLAQTSKSEPKDNQGWYGAKLKLDLPNGWETNLDFKPDLSMTYNCIMALTVQLE